MHAAITVEKVRNGSTCDVTGNDDETKSIQETYWQNNHDMEFKRRKFRETTCSPPLSTSSHHISPVLSGINRLNASLQLHNANALQTCRSSIPELSSLSRSMHQPSFGIRTGDNSDRKVGSPMSRIPCLVMSRQSEVSGATREVDFRFVSDSGSFSSDGALLLKTSQTAITSNSLTAGLTRSQNVFPFDDVTGGRRMASNCAPNTTFVYYTTTADVQRLCSTNVTGSVPIVLSPSMFEANNDTVDHSTIMSGTGFIDIKESNKIVSLSPMDMLIPKSSTALSMTVNPRNRILVFDPLTIKSEPDDRTKVSCDDVNMNRHIRLVTCGETVDSASTQRTISPAKPEMVMPNVEGTCTVDGMPVVSIRGSSGGPGQSVSTTSSKLYSCPICSRDFASEKYLSMHVSLHQQHTQQQTNGAGSSVLDLPVTPPLASAVVNMSDQIHQLNSYQQQSFLPSVSTYPTSSLVPSSIISSASAALKAPPPPPPIRKPKTGTGSKIGGGHWTCQICDKTFAQNSNYKNHIRTHSNERPFVCEICSIGFKERYHLKKHVLFKHTDELREECRVCGKRFKDSTAVRAHERTHSDQRPYACPRCDKTFKTSECLWHHENRSKTCGKSLGDLAVSGSTVTRLPLIAVSNSTDKEFSRRSGSSGKTTRRDRRFANSGGSSTRKQSGSLVAPLGLAIKSEPCRQPSLIRFPIEDEQMAYTEVVISDEIHQPRNHSIQTPHVNPLHHVAVSFGGIELRSSPAAFIESFEGTHSSVLRHCRLANIGEEVEAGFCCARIQLNPGSSTAARSPKVTNQTKTASSTASVNGTTSEIRLRPPSRLIVNDVWDLGDHDEQAILRHLESDTTVEHQNTEQYHHSNNHHHHQHHHHQIVQQNSHAVEVKVETDAMMELLDYNLTALNQSTDSSLFDDFSIDIGATVDDTTDYYHKFIENNEDEENNQHDWKIDMVRNSSTTTMTDGVKNKTSNDQKDVNSSQQMVNHQHAVIRSSSPTVLMTQQAIERFQPLSPGAVVVSTEQGMSSELSLLRPYRCDQCAVGFKLKVHLKKHNLYKHSNEYPCACGVCGKRFKDSSAVRLHERIHSTARPFECQRCGKSFKTRENLWGHRHRGPCDRGWGATRPGSPSGSSRGEALGTEADLSNDLQEVINRGGYTTCIPYEESVDNLIIHPETYSHLQSDLNKTEIPLEGSRSQARHVFDVGSEQIVVQASHGAKFLNQVTGSSNAASTASTGYVCTDATPMRICIGVGSAAIATNSDFVAPLWTSSSTQQHVASSPLSSTESEVSHFNKDSTTTTVKMGRRFIGRHPMTSGSPGIGAVVAAAAKAISMMQGPPVSAQTWLPSNSSQTGIQPMALLPTAVVAPIKREQPDIDVDCSSPPTADDYPCLSAVTMAQHPLYGVEHTESPTITAEISLEKYSLPPFETLIGCTANRPLTEVSSSSMSRSTSCNGSSLLPHSSGFGNCSNVPHMVSSGDLQYSKCNTTGRLPGIDQLFHKSASMNPKMTIRGAGLVASLNNVIELARASPSSFNGFQSPRTPQHHFNHSKLIEIVNQGNLNIWKRAQMPQGNIVNSPVPSRSGDYSTCFPPALPYQEHSNGIGEGVMTSGAISGRRFDFGESALTAASTGNTRPYLLSVAGKR